MKPNSGDFAWLDPHSWTLFKGQWSVMPLVVDLWRKRPMRPIAGGDGGSPPALLAGEQTETCADDPTFAFNRRPSVVLSLQVHGTECAAHPRAVIPGTVAQRAVCETRIKRARTRSAELVG